ncbi:hypothetical protein Tco_0391811, partial [Tanacetum coccineum]
MLAPRSANANHSSIPGNSQGIRNLPGSPSFLGNLFKMTAEQCSSIPGNSQGIRNLPGSPSFLGNLFKMTAEQCSFIEVRARQGSLEVRATS